MKNVIRLTLVFGVLAAGFASAQTSIICRVTPGTNPAQIATKYGLTLQDSTSGAPFALYAATDERTLGNLKHDPSIVWLEDDCDVVSPEDESKGKPTKGGGLPAVGSRSTLQTINKNLLRQINWNKTLSLSSGRTVKLAILDTGLAPKQTTLWAKVDASMNAVEPDQPAYDIPQGTDSNGNGIVDEAVGHGTMIAGIVDQVAPQVHLVVARVADSDGSATGWRVIKGLAFAVTSGAEVANVSLGTLLEVPALSDVIDWCTENNLLVVAPIGNNGQSAACYPAKFGDVICVGGLDAVNRKAWFSNWHTSCAISAPAIGFASQFWDGSLAVWSGTSFASPVVAAAVADGLRHGNPTNVSNLKDAVIANRTSILRLPPRYLGRLGGLIDYTKLVNSFSAGPGPK